jgi:23S rRNA (adenine2503-C2)-methyltransferase
MAPTRPTPHVGRSGSFSASWKSTPAEPAGSGRTWLSIPALRAWIADNAQPPYRVTQILAWIYRRRVTDFAAMTNLPHDLRAALTRRFAIPHLTHALVTTASDGTRKLLFQLDRVPSPVAAFRQGSGQASGNGAGTGRGARYAAIESVLIPDPPRLTLCISSQAGCGMGCAFCATARLGFLRNLSAEEIAGQVLAAQEHIESGARISNIVFMGMGEPLANYDAVVRAVEILTAHWGLGFSPRRVTVSTVGLVPALQRLVRDTAVNVAVSLSATTEAQRAALMPISRRHSLQALLATCGALPIPQRRRISFEYVMLAGVNDSPDDAGRLVRLLHGIRCKVNLIPFNPFPGGGFACSSEGTIRRFQDRLLAAGVHATIRQSRGRDIQAACGQLALAGGAARLS